jgi:flagellar protein FliO/FliZ
MKHFLVKLFFWQIAFFAVNAQAAEATTSASGSFFKMLVGLAIVLLILAGISWAMKKFMPGVSQQQSVVRVVGGTSLGARERVVVLEVAGRWIVVGVGGGQMTALANMEAGQIASNSEQSAPAAQNFATWLKASSSKFSEKKDAQE